MSDPEPRRQRRTRTRSKGEPDGGQTVEATDPTGGSANGGPGAGAASGAKGRDPERGWRDLAGNTPTIVGVSGALRARDIARPTPEDLAAAELEVSVVRRDWKPPVDAPAFNSKPGKPGR